VRPPLKVIIPDGARAGEYTLTDNLANFWDYIQTDPLMRLSVSCDAGTWYLFCSPCGTGACVATASSASCSPFGLIFPGADFGATGDITVELA
jgi:hypothetical protein